jgi:hypothetical protein
MSNRIDIVITEAPQVSASTPPLDRSNLTDETTGFSWTIAAQGGFKTAQLDCIMTRDRAFEVLQRFLSKRIIFTSPTALHPSQILWEGMVYQISIDDGKRTVTRSMANVYNRIEIIYSSTDYTQSKPQGAQQVALLLNDTTSQGLYGLRHMAYNVGEMSGTDATRLATIMLARYAYPQTVTGGQTVGGVPDGVVKVKIDCTGYGETLDKYIYMDQSTPNATLDTLIKSVINTFAVAGPTTIINTDYTNFTANTLQRSEYQIKYITALDYINDICAYGSSSVVEQNLFGVLENRTPYYIQFPTSVSYWQSVFDQSERIYDALTGAPVDPWNMRPAKLIALTDILPNIGYPYDADVLDVKQYLIGEVKFTAPNQVELTPWTGDPTQVVLHRVSAAGES